MNLNQITVPSLDLEKGIEFYRQLGLRLIVKALPHYARFECPEGGSTFSLHLVDRLPQGEGTYIYFECDDLDEKFEKLQQQGLSFDLTPTDQPWLWREARLRDPDGHLIILYYAGNNRRYPPWRLPEADR